MTKKFLMGLAEGAFIMSNMLNGPGQPTYFESVSAAPEREKQWKQIVLRGCDRRFGWVFKNEKDAMIYLGELYKEFPPAEPEVKQEHYLPEVWNALGKYSGEKDYSMMDDECRKIEPEKEK